MHTELVSHIVRGREAHCQEVGKFILAQLFPGDGRQSEVDDQGVPRRRCFEDVKPAIGFAQRHQIVGVGGVVIAFEGAFVGSVVLGLDGKLFGGQGVGPRLLHVPFCPTAFVPLFSPFGQFVHVPGAGDEFAFVLAIEPVSAVSQMPRRQDGPAVFDAHTNDFGLHARCQFQFVSDGGDPHAVR